MMPVQVYPLFEQAHRLKQGRTVDEQLVVASELWARFSDVAAANPHAWIQRTYTAEAIRTPSADNRWIGLPSTKLMTSHTAAEQDDGVFLCSEDRPGAHRV